jgi:hypothetical protein
LAIGTGRRVLKMSVLALTFSWRMHFDPIMQFVSIIVSIAFLVNPFAHIGRALQRR